MVSRRGSYFSIARPTPEPTIPMTKAALQKTHQLSFAQQSFRIPSVLSFPARTAYPSDEVLNATAECHLGGFLTLRPILERPRREFLPHWLLVGPLL